MSAQTGVPQAGLNIRASPRFAAFNLKEHFDPHSYAGMLQSILPIFEGYTISLSVCDNTTDLLAQRPSSVFINTSSDDFLFTTKNVDLAERLEKLGVDYEARRACKQWGEKLGHVQLLDWQRMNVPSIRWTFLCVECWGIG